MLQYWQLRPAGSPSVMRVPLSRMDAGHYPRSGLALMGVALLEEQAPSHEPCALLLCDTLYHVMAQYKGPSQMLSQSLGLPFLQNCEPNKLLFFIDYQSMAFSYSKRKGTKTYRLHKTRISTCFIIDAVYRLLVHHKNYVNI